MTKDIKTTPGNRDTPPMRSPDANKRRIPTGATTSDDSDQAPAAPKMSGASAKNAGMSKSNVADRNPENRRESGVTPRPTDESGGL
ncbi:hypothetical protein [Mesorhizobium sp.]|uniref:hypothetical protein n=1 Tax=Mesorhizobium sp. TaxID=1871066 RepID=UPI000FE2ABB8|nr:hypothetical protein [Mesorhizobium sp.]RWC00626.1 MAG: hypothetical protein EOQ56_15240 [Mesorhizobium sp.]RWP68092.1 MAG: hypothetical protein EOR07_07605 [Mesorhizobium sp.]RWQ19902.1 MAG: hypothetical protein EOR92_12300 [Mesorhizobium sp.]